MTEVPANELRARRSALEREAAALVRQLARMHGQAVRAFSGVDVTSAFREAARAVADATQGLRAAMFGAVCAHDGDTWFDRELCPEPCGAMHTRCRECGRPLDECPLEAVDAPPE